MASSLIETLTVAEQLLKLYNQYAYWDNNKPTGDKAVKYYQDRLANGSIVCYIQDNIVLGYYERYIYDNTVFFCNGIILPEFRKGIVFKKLYKHFMQTLPLNITKIVFYQQKAKGKFRIMNITKERRE